MSAIPELKQKKIVRDLELKKSTEAAVNKALIDEAELTKTIYAKAEKYEADYEALYQTAIDNRYSTKKRFYFSIIYPYTNNRREAKANNQIFVIPEEKLVFVIRVRGIIGVSPKVKKILQLLRLRQIHNGVFVRINAATLKMLRLVEPFIAYGYPSLKSVKEIIYKRGFGKVSGQRIPISSNTVVAASLGEKGFQCIEDVIHEIFTVGPEFKAASNFLWPFKLSSPKGGFKGKKLNHFNEGGACGQQGYKINLLIKKML
jgi:60S ribosomal protein uL30